MGKCGENDLSSRNRRSYNSGSLTWTAPDCNRTQRIRETDHSSRWNNCPSGSEYGDALTRLSSRRRKLSNGRLWPDHNLQFRNLNHIQKKKEQPVALLLLDTPTDILRLPQQLLQNFLLAYKQDIVYNFFGRGTGFNQLQSRSEKMSRLAVAIHYRNSSSSLDTRFVHSNRVIGKVICVGDNCQTIQQRIRKAPV